MNNRTFNYLARENAVPCPSGERYKDKCILVKNGDNLSLKKVGRIDTVEQIQSHHDGVCLQKMIERFNRTGDVGVFGSSRGFYADVVGASDDLQETINNTRDAMRVLENLPKTEVNGADGAQDPADQSAASVPNSEKIESEVTANA